MFIDEVLRDEKEPYHGCPTCFAEFSKLMSEREKNQAAIEKEFAIRAEGFRKEFNMPPELTWQEVYDRLPDVKVT